MGVNLACLRNSQDALEVRAEGTKGRVLPSKAKKYGGGVRDRLRRVQDRIRT